MLMGDVVGTLTDESPRCQECAECTAIFTQVIALWTWCAKRSSCFGFLPTQTRSKNARGDHRTSKRLTRDIGVSYNGQADVLMEVPADRG